MKRRVGLACLSPERRAAIARLGALAAKAKGTAHRWTREEAVIAGQKGGAVTKGRYSAFTSESAIRANHTRWHGGDQ